MKKLILFCLSVLCHTAMWAQMIIPAPREMKVVREGKVKVTSTQERIDRGMKLPSEGYTIQVRGTKAVIKAKDERGLVWARQTLRQLKDEEGLSPQVTIRDWPEFPIRGFMHDTGRNYRPVERLAHRRPELADATQRLSCCRSVLCRGNMARWQEDARGPSLADA